MKDVIVALDFKDRAQTLEFLDKFTDKKPYVKMAWSFSMRKAPPS